jgi:hypothetical protein
MDKHVKILGLLNTVYGAAALVLPLLILGLTGGVTEFYYKVESVQGAVLIVGLTLLNLLLAIPCLVGGLLLRQFSDSGRYLGIVLSTANLLNVPFGAILGAYGLWVLLSPETEMLFLHPMRRRKAKHVQTATEDEQEDEAPRTSKAQVKPRPSRLTS